MAVKSQYFCVISGRTSYRKKAYGQMS